MPGETSPHLATTVESDSASNSLIKVANWDGRSQEIHKALTAAFEAKDYLECINDLRALQIDPSPYINNLDTVSPHSVPKHLVRFVTIGDRSSTAFRPTQSLGDDAYER